MKKEKKIRHSPMLDLLNRMNAIRSPARSAEYLRNEIRERERYLGEITVVVSPRYSNVFRLMAKLLGARYWYPEIGYVLRVGDRDKILQAAHLVTGAECIRAHRLEIRHLLYQFSGGPKPHQFVSLHVCFLKPSNLLMEAGAEVISVQEVNPKKWKKGACHCPGVHQKRKKRDKRRRKRRAAA